MIEAVADLILERIAAQDANRPRSLQASVGPSDLGGDCDHCLAAKFAGWTQTRELAWLPYVGTAVHASLGQAFDTSTGEWLVESPVSVGKVAGVDVWGTADLFHLPTRTVVDFKVVGITTLRKARAAVKAGRGIHDPKYRAQAHLYGAGFEARHVAVMYLPRNAPDLAKELVWAEEGYSPDVVASTLKRASLLCAGVNGAGNEADYIATLERAEGCYDCPRYFDWDTHASTVWAASAPRTVASLTEAMGHA